MDNLTDHSWSGMWENVTEADVGNMTTNGSLPAPGGGAQSPVSYSLPWDNPDNIMRKETSDDITFSLQCFVFPVLTVVGLVGNGLSMAVMLQKKLRHSTTTIVIVGLAVSDTLFLITNMYRKSQCIIKEFDPMLADEINAKSFRYAFYLKTAFSRVSTLLVVVISLERLIAVAFPLMVKSLVTETRMLCAVVFCFLFTFACLAGLPPQYTYGTVGGRTYIQQTDFALENVAPLKVYNEMFLPIAFRYIPVLLVIILNVAIVALIRRSASFQKKANSQDGRREEEQRKITRMLLAISLIYLIALLPGDILLIVSDAVDGFNFFGKYHNAFLALSDISLLFELVNSSINFIIYMVLNQRFKEVYMDMFCRCLKGTQLLRGFTSKLSSGSAKMTAETGVAQSSVVVVVGQKPAAAGREQGTAGDGAGSSRDNAEASGHDNQAFQE